MALFANAASADEADSDGFGRGHYGAMLLSDVQRFVPKGGPHAGMFDAHLEFVGKAHAGMRKAVATTDCFQVGIELNREAAGIDEADVGVAATFGIVGNNRIFAVGL